MGFWSVVTPEATQNLVTNPSLELATTGWTAVGGTRARSAAAQFRGAYSLAVTPTSATGDGVYYGTITLANGTTYTLSFYVKGAAGVPYTAYFASTVPAVLGTPTTFTGDGTWQRVTVTWAENAGAARRLYIIKNAHASTAVFYVDAVQVEAKAYATDYCDGEQDGCRWDGAEHAATSTRDAGSRAGGREINLDTYSTYMLRPAGGGMPPVQVVISPYALADGALYQRSLAGARVLTLAQLANGTSQVNLHSLRQSLIDLIKPDGVAVQQPTLWRYSGATRAVEIGAVYDAGLELAGQEGFTETLAERLLAPDPFFYELGEQGAALSVQTSIASVALIMQRSAAGAWAALGAGPTGTYVHDLEYGPDGTLYAATSAGVYSWDGSSWTTIGTAAGGRVIEIIFDAAGALYAVGEFTGMSSVANTKMVAKYASGSWSSISSGLTGTEVTTLAVGNDGSIYVAGLFSVIGGTTAANVAKYTGSAWVALGAGLSGEGFKLVIGPDNLLYAGTGAGLYRYTGAAWTTLGTLTGAGGITSLLFLPSGLLLIGGLFSAIGGVTAANIASYNGAGFAPLGGGVSGGSAEVFNMVRTGNGAAYLVGNFTVAGGVTMPDRMALWNGSAFVSMDIDTPGTPTVYAIVLTAAGVLTVGIDSSGTAISAAITTLTNSGKAAAYPVLRITSASASGTSRLYQLVNYTTGDALYFNLTFLNGEVLTLDLRPGRKSVVSNFRGNVLSAVLPGSNLATWKLAPGDNSVSLFISGASDTCAAHWRVRHWSVDGGA